MLHKPYYSHPEYQYLMLCAQALEQGTLQANRTTARAWTIDGGMMQFDMADGFPLLTTKQVFYKKGFAEQVGFLRGLDNAQDFADLGCDWWFKDANENTQWLASPYRKGENDLGRIYGVQWRKWRGKASTDWNGHVKYEEIDQIQQCLDDIRAALVTGRPSRRIIFIAWRPDEFDQMALPPCHVSYEFLVNVEKKELNLTMWQRSCDMFLGVPMNIANAALTLHLFAAAAGLKPRRLTHFLSDVHVYENHVDQVQTMLGRMPRKLPMMSFLHPMNPLEWTADDMAAINPWDIVISGYSHHGPLKGEMVTG